MTDSVKTIDYIETIVSKLFEYKTIASLLALIINLVAYIKGQSIFGVSATFLSLISLLMIADWFTGVKASKAEGQVFKSSKVMSTIIKFITLFLWLWLSQEIEKLYGEVAIADLVVGFISVFVLILVALREFVSIGENIETIYKYKPYIFHLVDDIFGMFESIFKKKIKNENNTE